MIASYIGFKFVHVLIAIIALGTGAALGILLAFFAGHPTHGAFVLRTVRTLLYCVVIPGYVLMLITGMWTAHLGALLDARWAEAAMNLWGLGIIFIALTAVGVHRQIASLDSAGSSSLAYRRAALLWKFSGMGAGIVILAMIYLMVFKP
jgi:uncharacterized membrane protein